jgi:hypothetical protein
MVEKKKQGLQQSQIIAPWKLGDDVSVIRLVPTNWSHFARQLVEHRAHVGAGLISNDSSGASPEPTKDKLTQRGQGHCHTRMAGEQAAYHW